MTVRRSFPGSIIAGLALLVTGCSAPLQRDEFMTWDIAGSGDPELPLESGLIVVTSSPHPLDLFASLLPASYNPYVHAAIVSIEGDRLWVYEQFGQQWPNPFAESPTDNVHGRVRRVPLREFVDRYEHVEFWDAGPYDKDRIVAFARDHYRRKTPFDAYFDHGETERLYCTEFVALALESGGAAPFTPVPNRDNRSARVVLDWLRVPDSLIQADTLVAGGRRVATLSLERSMTEIRLRDAARRELYRRFTCDQRVGSLFAVSGSSVRLRGPVEYFMLSATMLYPADQPIPPQTDLEAEIAVLARQILGPWSPDVECPTSSRAH